MSKCSLGDLIYGTHYASYRVFVRKKRMNLCARRIKIFITTICAYVKYVLLQNIFRIAFNLLNGSIVTYNFILIQKLSKLLVLIRVGTFKYLNSCVFWKKVRYNYYSYNEKTLSKCKYY